MIIGNAYIKGENREMQEITVIIFGATDEIKKCNLENILIKRYLETTNILFSGCVLINCTQKKPTRKVIQIGGFYFQDTLPDTPCIMFVNCVLKNCIIPFENIYMHMCVVKNE